MFHGGNSTDYVHLTAYGYDRLCLGGGDDTVDALWGRIAAALGRFDPGVYLSDLRFASGDRGVSERAFDALLGAFVRGKVHAYRGDEAAALAALRSAGFEEARLHRGDLHPAAADARRDPGSGMISIIEAGRGRPPGGNSNR